MHAYPHHVNTVGSVITLKKTFFAYAITIITETYAPVGITKNNVCVFLHVPQHVRMQARVHLQAYIHLYIKLAIVNNCCKRDSFDVLISGQGSRNDVYQQVLSKIRR